MHELVVNTEYVLTIRFRPVHTTQRSLKVYVLMLWRRYFCYDRSTFGTSRIAIHQVIQDSKIIS